MFIAGNPDEIHELARYEMRPGALDQCLAAIHEFVAHVRANEPGALRYEVWQEAGHPTRVSASIRYGPGHLDDECRDPKCVRSRAACR
jgi:Antibiotic biosynthesis monooxygenase